MNCKLRPELTLPLYRTLTGACTHTHSLDGLYCAVMSPIAKCKYYCCTWDGLDKLKTVLNTGAGACSALPIRNAIE